MSSTEETYVAKLARHQLIGANFSFQHHSLDFCAARLHEMGFERMELWGIAPHLDIARATDRDVAEVKRTLRAHGLGLRTLTPEQVVYPVNIASGDDAYREASILQFMRAAEIAADLGADYLFLTPGRGFENESAGYAWDRSCEALTRIITRSAELGLRCLLEPLQRVESNIVNDAAGLARMLDELPSRHADVVLDTVAMAVAGDNVQDYLERFGRRIAHVHLVDGTPAGHLVWGDGAVPLGSVVAALAETGYDGTLTFEPFGDGGYALDPVAAWRRNLAAFAPYLDRKEGAA